MKGLKIKGLKTMLIISLLLILNLSTVNAENNYDFDPLSDIYLTVEINSIRALEDDIDKDSDPDFFIRVFINNDLFQSQVYHDTKYLYDINWTATKNVPDDEKFVDIVIELWDKDVVNKSCDISPDDISTRDHYNVEIKYDIRTGHWTGDDSLGCVDESGYGRLNGCDDESFYKKERDCELWFSIYQNDYDNDNVPYWAEVNLYNTDPLVSNLGEDLDNDFLPFEYEHFWGYNPMLFEEHKEIDPEHDSLTNYEEYLTHQWKSNPYADDLFLELDQMEEGPRGQGSKITDVTRELITTPYSKRNIVFHLDDGCMGGGETLPYERISWITNDRDIYQKYFLENEWRRGVFRYGIIVNEHKPIAGLEFAGDGTIVDFCRPGLNCFIISSKIMEKSAGKTGNSVDYIFACAIFHELGHTMGVYMGYPPGCDNQFSNSPFQIGWWRYKNYKSSMNYHYTYKMIDYSDGTNGRNDFNDWGNMELTHFEYSDKESESQQNSMKDEIVQFISEKIEFMRYFLLLLSYL